jgi:hypothetical protein
MRRSRLLLTRILFPFTLLPPPLAILFLLLVSLRSRIAFYMDDASEKKIESLVQLQGVHVNALRVGFQAGVMRDLVCVVESRRECSIDNGVRSLTVLVGNCAQRVLCRIS